MSGRADEDLSAILAETKLRPACEGLSRKETTSLLSSELVRLVLTRKNAYSYWAHEVEVYDERKGATTWVDFMQFEPAGYHTATHPGNVERGTFTCYEVKSCIADIKSGHGLNWFGDENYMVIPVELFPKFRRAYHGSFEKNFEDRDEKLREHIPSLYGFKFMFYGIGRNGRGAFRTLDLDDLMRRLPRTKPASELLLCMMRAMLANSDRADVSHRIVRTTAANAQAAAERLRGEGENDG